MTVVCGPPKGPSTWTALQCICGLKVSPGQVGDVFYREAQRETGNAKKKDCKALTSLGESHLVHICGNLVKCSPSLNFQSSCSVRALTGCKVRGTGLRWWRHSGDRFAIKLGRSGSIRRLCSSVTHALPFPSEFAHTP